MNRPGISPRLFELFGCLVAPLPMAAFALARSIFSGRAFEINDFGIPLLVYIVALGLTIFLGYPMYLLLLRFVKIQWWMGIWVGFLIGALATHFIVEPDAYVSADILTNASIAAICGLLFWAVQELGNENKAGKVS